MKGETLPEEVAEEAAPSDAPSVDDSLFGHAPDDKTAANVEAEDAKSYGRQDEQGSDDAENQDGPSEDLKVVVSIKGGRATIGVQRPSADPHIETFDDSDLSGLAQEVPAVTERARARWEDTPKHPAYGRPAPLAWGRNRRQQRMAQATPTEGEETQQQPETLRLF